MSHSSRALASARHGHAAEKSSSSSSSSVAALSAARAMRQRRVRQELQDDQKKELKDAFELFDADKRGSIDYHELKVSGEGVTVWLRVDGDGYNSLWLRGKRC